MSKGQGLTRDTLDEVTDAEDLWLQSLERKKPDKKPRTADASPVSRAMVTAWNRKDHCESELVILILLLTMVRGRLGSSESDLLDFTEIIENCINHHHVQHLLSCLTPVKRKSGFVHLVPLSSGKNLKQIGDKKKP